MEEENKYISGETRTGFAFSILKKALKKLGACGGMAGGR